MKNHKRNRKNALRDRRFLRLEALESRLPFAVDVISFYVDSWLMPVAENSLSFDEQWISSPSTTKNDLIATVPFDALPVEVAYSIPDLFDATGSYRYITEDNIAIRVQPAVVMGTTVPLIDEIFATDLGLSDDDALLSNSGNLVPVNLSTAQINDAMFSHDWWIPAGLLQAVRLALHSDAIEGLAIPVGEFSLSSFEGDAGGVKATTTFAAGNTERLVSTEPPLSERSRLISADRLPITEEGSLLGGFATRQTIDHLKVQTASLQTHEGRTGRLYRQSSSFLGQGPSQPNHAGQFQQHYQTLGEMLEQNGMELATESQLSIQKEQAKAPTSLRSQEIDYRSRIEIAQVNAKLPVHMLPEGMLAIGNEIGVKNYRPAQHYRLNEDFVAQTELICGDLHVAASADRDSKEPPPEESPSFNTPERIRWVAIGSTIVITHASLLARKSREASITKWLLLKLPKFTKHDRT